MNQRTTIITIAALVVGLSGGAAATYCWLRTPPRPTAPAGSDLHDDEHEGDGHVEPGAGEEDHQSVVRLSPGQMEQFGIELARAAPGTLLTRISLPGHIVLNEDRVAHMVLRAPGIVREVLKKVGDTVRAGEVMAWIESAELGDAKVDFLTKWAEVSCCTIDLTRAEEVHDNTLRLLEMLQTSPSMDTLRQMDGVAMGDNRSALVSAHAEFVFAQAAFEREKPLREKKVSSEREYQEAEATYKKADALYTATRDSIEFKVRRELLEARRARQVRATELRGAERRLYVLGLAAEEIGRLELLARSPTPPGRGKVNCDDPNCQDCAGHGPEDRDTTGAALHKADEKLAWYPLRAPFDGTVIDKHLTLGEKPGHDWVAFTVADLSSVWLNISVYQKDLAEVKKGQSVRIITGQGRTSAPGMISFVAPTVDEKTRTALARVVLPNPRGQWRPGQFVTAELSVAEQSALVVLPKAAVQRIGDETVVFIETDDGLKPAPVSLGRSNASHIEILSGVAAGQRYVANGAFELKAKMVTSGLGAHAGHGH